MQSPRFKSSASNWYQRPFNHGLSLGDGRNKPANCPHLSFNQHRPSPAKICDKILLAGKSTRSRFTPRSLDKGEGIFLDAHSFPRWGKGYQAFDSTAPSSRQLSACQTFHRMLQMSTDACQKYRYRMWPLSPKHQPDLLGLSKFKSEFLWNFFFFFWLGLTFNISFSSCTGLASQLFLIFAFFSLFFILDSRNASQP